MRAYSVFPVGSAGTSNEDVLDDRAPELTRSEPPFAVPTVTQYPCAAAIVVHVNGLVVSTSGSGIS